MRNLLTVMVAGVMFVGPHGALAQDRGALQSQAKTALGKFRAVGEPKDRCSMNAWIADGGAVVRTGPGSALNPGDQLVAVGVQTVEGKRSDDIVAVLRNLGPSDSVAIRIKRSGAEKTVELQCANARPVTETYVGILEQVAAGKFDDCVTAIGDRRDLGTGGALLRAQCAAASKKSASYDQTQLTFDALRWQLEDARWNPPARNELVINLRAAEGSITQGLGASKYQELVALTRSWPGGETLYADSAPDWPLFKRNSEVALRGRLIDPDSARIEWPYGFTYGTWRPMFSKPIEGYWSCGNINARNRMGGYVGSTAFVVVLDPKAGVKYVEMGDGREFDMLSAQCGKSVKLLPSPPPFLTAASAPAASTVSLADELKKLSDLKSAGALTDAEFEAAKKRLLSQ